MKISPPIKQYRFSAHFSGNFVVDGQRPQQGLFAYPRVTHWDIQSYAYNDLDDPYNPRPANEANIEFIVEGHDEEDAFSAGFQKLEDLTYPGILKDATSSELRITTD